MSVIELNVLAGLKLALRAFGGPRTVYQNLPRSTGRFTRAHRLELESLENGRARYRYHDESGVGYHRHDCRYSMGMLASVPTMFGHLAATVRHPECGVDGAPACIFEVTWDHRTRAEWAPLGLAVAGAVVAAVSSRPRLALPIPALGAVLAARGVALTRRQQRRSLEAEIRDEQETGRRLTASLRDLVSERRIDDVLRKIIESAQGALPGREFALMVLDEDGVHCRSSSRVPSASLVCLEGWAAASPHVLDAPLTLDDLASVPDLAELAEHVDTPLGALSVAPLAFRSSRLGALVALAHQTDAFLPRETDLLETYAAEAAIALANARLFERLERLARHDSLTGLLNHREFQEALARELDAAQRDATHLSVVLLDLDGFKRVNDEFGHAEGDRILKMAAEVILIACRGCGHAFRIGGDEFALILPGARALEAEALAVRAGAGIQALEVGMRASWGVAEWPTAGPSQSLVLFNADRSLYEAKARANPPRVLARDAPDIEVERRGLAGAERHRRGLTTALARAVDAKDSYTRSHSETVAELSSLIAVEIGLEPARVGKIRLAGLLHDVGKIGIADAILQKPGPLTEEEFLVMKTHSTLGHSILSGAELFEEAEWILHHHERVDGRGTPTASPARRCRSSRG
jgi:diguanylate cyclase (GGDEF)-like protein